MNKTILAIALMFAATAASATSLQVEGGRTFAGADKNLGRVAVTESVLGLNTQLGYTRTFNDRARTEAVSALVGRDLLKVAGVSLSAFGGGQFARASKAEGFGLVYGVGASYPLTKSIDAIVDVRQVRGQNRIKAVDGNTVNAGLSVKF